MIEYDKFQQSLKHLELQFANYRTLDQALPDLMQEAVAESVIQRFETCWDCLWKVLKRYLVEEVALPEVPNGPNPILRLANENHLLSSPIEAWLQYAKARVATTGVCEKKTQGALILMDDFIRDAIELYRSLSKKGWR